MASRAVLRALRPSWISDGQLISDKFKCRGPISSSWFSCLEMSKWSVQEAINLSFSGNKVRISYTLPFGLSKWSRSHAHPYAWHLECMFLRRDPSSEGCTIA